MIVSVRLTTLRIEVSERKVVVVVVVVFAFVLRDDPTVVLQDHIILVAVLFNVNVIFLQKCPRLNEAVDAVTVEVIINDFVVTDDLDVVVAAAAAVDAVLNTVVSSDQTILVGERFVAPSFVDEDLQILFRIRDSRSFLTEKRRQQRPL